MARKRCPECGKFMRLDGFVPYDKVWDEIEHYFAMPDDVVDPGNDDWLYELRAEADRRLDELYDGVTDPGDICGECRAGAHQG